MQVYRCKSDGVGANRSRESQWRGISREDLGEGGLSRRLLIMVRIVGNGEQRGLVMLLQVAWDKVVGIRVMEAQVMKSQVMEAQAVEVMVGFEALGEVEAPQQVAGLMLTISALISR